MNSQDLGAGRLLAGDAIIAVLLANELRHRLVESVFGVARKDSNPVTAVAFATLAEGAQARLLVAPALPSVAVVALAAAAVKESTHTLAGDWSRAMPGFGAVIAIAVVGTAAGPSLRATARATQRSLHRARMASREFRALLTAAPSRSGGARQD
jgi:hypothetical protein